MEQMASDINNKKKNYISIGITMSFPVLLVSGVALYLAPSCRVAEKIGWRFCFLGKESWEGVHITFGLLFLVLSIIHIVLNWRILLSYFKKGVSGIASVDRAVIICSVAAIVLFFMAAFNLPPAGWLHRAHEYIKFSWGPPCEEIRADPSGMEKGGRGRYQRGL